MGKLELKKSYSKDYIGNPNNKLEVIYA